MPRIATELVAPARADIRQLAPTASAARGDVTVVIAVRDTAGSGVGLPMAAR